MSISQNDATLFLPEGQRFDPLVVLARTILIRFVLSSYLAIYSYSFCHSLCSNHTDEVPLKANKE